MTQVRIARLAADTAPTPIPEPQAPLSTLAEALPAAERPGCRPGHPL
jgi:hypothetical protein